MHHFLVRAISCTAIQTVTATIPQVFALLTDPARIPSWLPACQRVKGPSPLKKGDWFRVQFGERQTVFEVVDLTPPVTFGWVEQGHRQGWKTLFRLDATGGATAVTLRLVWVPRSFAAWVRGRLLDKRNARRQLSVILQNLQRALTGS